MTRRPSMLTGTAGVYYVAYQLAARGFHAAVTYGNAPTVDLLVGLLDGAAAISLQVKTSAWAERNRGRGKNKGLDHYEWEIGRKAASICRPDLFFALVDLKSRSGKMPDVFIVPSDVIFNAFKPYLASRNARRLIWSPRISDVEPFKNNWDALHNYLEGKNQTSTSVSLTNV